MTKGIAFGQSELTFAAIVVIGSLLAAVVGGDGGIARHLHLLAPVAATLVTPPGSAADAARLVAFTTFAIAGLGLIGLAVLGHDLPGAGRVALLILALYAAHLLCVLLVRAVARAAKLSGS